MGRPLLSKKEQMKTLGAMQLFDKKPVNPTGRMTKYGTRRIEIFLAGSCGDMW